MDAELTAAVERLRALEERYYATWVRSRDFGPLGKRAAEERDMIMAMVQEEDLKWKASPTRSPSRRMSRC